MQNENLKIAPQKQLDLFFYKQLIFSSNEFIMKSFKITIKVSNSFDPDQAIHFVRPDFGLILFTAIISMQQKGCP